MVERMYCADCEQTVIVTRKMSISIIIISAILFLPVAIVYMLYKYMCPEFVCPICGGKNFAKAEG